jgi:hypothetical protein
VLNRILKLCAAAFLGLSVATLAPSAAQAIGYYNVPGNCCQCWGYGCGAGYHACLLLGPVSYHDCCNHGVERLPYAPCLRCGYAGCGYGCGCNVGEPSLLEPSVAPAQLPAPTPEPALSPAAYRVPFRY